MPLSAQAAAVTADTFDDLRDLMEEPPGGQNYGRVAGDPDVHGAYLPLSVEEAQERDLLQAGGWGLIETSRGSGGFITNGAADAGMTAHRGVTHPDEYIDAAVRVAAFEHLGFTPDEVQSVYRQGRLTDQQGELRASIDARLLALSRAGGNMLALARVLGFAIKPGDQGGNCRTLDNALARAKAVEGGAS